MSSLSCVLPFLFPSILDVRCKLYWCKKTIHKTTEGGGLTLRSVLPSGLGCKGLRFKSCNDKRLRLNPTTPALDPLVPTWGWNNSYGSPVPSGPTR